MTTPLPTVLGLVGLLCLPLLLGGCGAGTAVGAGAKAGTMAMEERGFEAAVEDRVTEGKIAAALLEADKEIFEQVEIEVVEGRVLLTGIVPEQEDRIEAVRITWQVDEVTEVINEIKIGKAPTTFEATARDVMISAEINSTLMFDQEVMAINYLIEVSDRTVYVFGIAQDQEERERVLAHARGTDYVRAVVDHVRLKTDPRRPVYQEEAEEKKEEDKEDAASDS